MKKNTTTALLAVIAVLLAANLFVKTNDDAQAQLTSPLRLVGITEESSGTDRLYRLWSDGLVEHRTFGQTGSVLCWEATQPDWLVIEEVCP